MKANEFIKKHGLSEARIALAYCNAVHYGDVFYKNTGINVSELKRLVESHELIEKDFGSIEIAEYEHMVSGCYSDSYWLRVKQAIFDVESCQ